MNLLIFLYTAHWCSANTHFAMSFNQPPTQDVKPEEPSTLNETIPTTPAPKTRMAAKFPGPSATSTPMPKSRVTDDAMEGFAKSMDIEATPKVGISKKTVLKMIFKTLCKIVIQMCDLCVKYQTYLIWSHKFSVDTSKEEVGYPRRIFDPTVRVSRPWGCVSGGVG